MTRKMMVRRPRPMAPRTGRRRGGWRSLARMLEKMDPERWDLEVITRRRDDLAALSAAAAAGRGQNLLAEYLASVNAKRAENWKEPLTMEELFWQSDMECPPAFRCQDDEPG